MDDPDAKVLVDQLERSWRANADAWTRAVRDGRIASRVTVTNGAILAAVRRLTPTRVLDVGCGEGWLAHALAREGIDVVGFDASPELIDAARNGPGTFVRLDYDTLVQDAGALAGPFDVVACNFALLDEDPAPLLAALAARLAPRGRVVVQTVHPWSATGPDPYRSGWREERFEGFAGPPDGGVDPDAPSFTAAMPWYFHTLASWSAAFQRAGLVLERLEEPRAEMAVAPASLLVTLAPAGART